MTLPKKTIETLPAKGDEVKTDLTSLKSETQKTIEALKTPQTPAVPEKPADSTLEKKAEQDVSVEKIKADIAVLKKDNEALQVKKADFEKNKKTLSQAEVEKTQKEIDDEKARIERKKQELADIVKQTKAALAMLKDEITTPSKKIELDQMEKDIQAIKVDQGNRFERTWDSTKNFVSDHKQGLLIGGGIIGGRLLLRSLFKRKKKEGKNDEEGFFNHGIGKYIKYAGIAVGSFLGLRWLINQFTPKTNARDDVTNSETPLKEAVAMRETVPEGLKPKYNECGQSVKDMYKTVFQGEMRGIDAPDKLVVAKDPKTNQEKTLPAGIFPAVLDKMHDNVGEILSTKSIYNEGLTGYADRLVEYIQGKITAGVKSVGNLFAPFTGLFGLTSKMFNKDGSATGEFNGWLADKNMDKNAQIEFILRQYIRIRVYLFQKELLLRRKLTAKALGLTDINDPQVNDKLEDATFQAPINVQLKTLFEDRKIVSADGASAMETLRENSLLNGDFDPSIATDIKNINEREEHDVGDSLKTAVEKNATLKNTDIISADMAKELIPVADKFTKTVNDDVWEENWFDMLTFWAPADVWFNREKKDIKEVMKAMNYDKIKAGFLTKNNEILLKLKNGTATKADIEELKEVIDSFYMLQKEVLLGGQMENKQDAKRTTTQKLGITLNKMCTIEFGATAAGIICTFKANSRLVKHLKFGVMDIVSIPLRPTGLAMRHMPGMDNTMVTARLRRRAYKGPWGEKRFLKDFRAGLISPEQADKLIRSKGKKYGRSIQGKSKINLISEELFGVNGSPEIYENGLKKAITVDDFERVYKNYNMRVLVRETKESKGNMIDLFQEFFNCENKIKTMSGNNQLFAKTLMEKGNFMKTSDLKNVYDSLDGLHLEGMATKDVEKLAKSVGKDISFLKTPAEFNARLQELQQAIKTTATETKIGTKAGEAGIEELTATQRILHTKLEGKVSALKVQASAKGATKFEKLSLDESIGELENVMKTLKTMPEGEISSVNKLLDIGVDIKYTSKILATRDVKILLAEIDGAKDASRLKNVLEGHGLGTLVKTLEQTNKMDKLFEDFKPLAKELMPLLEEGKNITKIVKAISKVAEVIK